MLKESKGLGEKMRLMRVMIGVTHRELAAIPGIIQPVLFRWETGSGPSTQSLRKLNQVFDTNPPPLKVFSCMMEGKPGKEDTNARKPNM